MANESEQPNTSTNRDPPGTVKSIVGLVLAIAFTSAVAAFGARFTPDQWFDELTKPSFNPPGWVFGPVWTVLYTMMAVAAWMVWRERGFVGAKIALSVYVFQLVLNSMWTFLFFGRHQIGIALIDITGLWIAIVVTMLLFWRIKRTAAILLVPYLAWVSFATLLNFAFWRLNG